MKLRIILVVSMLLVTASAWADNIIFVPRGTTLTSRQFRGQAMFGGKGEDGNLFSCSIGLKKFELGFRHAEYENGRKEELFSGQWNVLPETFITPAIGVGVHDVTSESVEGIGFYGAMTKQLPIERYTNIIQDLSVTVGMGIKSMNGFFCGAEFKLPFYLVGQIEYDGDNWNSAICWQPTDTFRLKAYRADSRTFYGCEFIPLEF